MSLLLVMFLSFGGISYAQVSDVSQDGPNFEINSVRDDRNDICGINNCTLREAINAANANSDASKITFAPNVVGTIQLALVLPDLTTDISIIGPGVSGFNTLSVNRNFGGDYRIFSISNGSTVSISGLILSNGFTNDNGGCVLNDHSTLTLSQCSIHGISQSSGGAIFNNGENGQIATTTVVECSFPSGQATLYGGAICNSAVNGHADLYVRRCFFDSNQAGKNGGSIYSNGQGGVAHVEIENSTFDLSNADKGGAISNEGDGGMAFASIYSCTFYQNNANSGGSTIWSSGDSNSTVRISSNIFQAGSKGDSLADSGNGSLKSGGSNIASDGVGDDPATIQIREGYLNGPNDKIRTDPMLDSARFNGGLWETHSLLQGSPAINQDYQTNVSTDQRGVTRAQGNFADIGAYEAAFISIGDVTITEADKGTQNAVFPVTISAATSAPVNMNYATINNAGADPATDFDATKLSDSDGGTTGTLTIPAGQTTGSITVPIVGDRINEVSELFYVFLSSPMNAVFAKARGTGIITDNDSLPKFAVSDVTVNEGNIGTRNVTFVVSLNKPSGRVVSVDASTGGGNAVAGRDYQFLPKTTLSFSPGQTQRFITLAITGDVLDEVDEFFFLNLNNPYAAVIDDSKGKCVILDDDRAPALSISDTNLLEGNDGTQQLKFAVKLSSASGQTIRVDCATADGIARSTSDYQSKLGTITFSPDQTTKTFTVTINGDTTVEGDETLYVLLSNAQNASIGRGRGQGIILNDDGSG